MKHGVHRIHQYLRIEFFFFNKCDSFTTKDNMPPVNIINSENVYIKYIIKEQNVVKTYTLLLK